ncbi:Uncharacterized protein Rs2_40365 [Raphanus sativus]|uniref:Uncharacterized protein LOC108826670 n=1 Tax=Raphanus sativus TaxID=3726 RepID=A0A6J0L5Y9_RAPSA|nr:uncharacterized protein LOC108826670 [Raphanus sativus]KAJ4875347.1 Uncharacterized protein Rs2_40365 [Raphanus sativus]
MEETRKKEDERGRDTAAVKGMQTQMTIPREDVNEEEYTPEEIMQLVDSSSSPTTMNVDGTNFSGEENFRVRFIDDPYAVPVVVQSSTGYITINVNEESCGPSFSDSNASAMASVDATGLFGCCLGLNGAWSTDEMRASESGCECEWDDELLARFIGEDSVLTNVSSCGQS